MATKKAQPDADSSSSSSGKNEERQRPSKKSRTSSKNQRRKTRTGCRTCKLRRLKCDELKPACLRCTSTGRLCDGYGPLAIASLPFDIPGTDEERRSYHFFCLQTATAILGQQDATYWTTSLLQLAYAQPAVKHALIAMASIHEALQSTDWYLNANDNERGRTLRMFSWKQYNQAIQSVLRDTSDSRMPLEILIILCLLFNQYDNFQCDYAAAYMHIQSGLRLVQQWSQHMDAQTPNRSKTTATTEDMIKDHVAPMLTRLNVQASFLMHSEAHAPPYTAFAKTDPPKIPTNFKSFSKARQVFDHAASYMFHILDKKPEDCNEAMKPVVKELYERWWLALGSLLGRTPVRLGSNDDRAARLLRVYYNFALIVLDTHHDPDEMGFDKQTERFDVIVQQSQDLISLPSSNGEHPGQPFSFDVSLASPLNFVGARCRFPHIRRQAIAILKSAVKSSWNSEHCALVAQYLMETEEKGLGIVGHCKDIPSENRVRRIYSDICFEDRHIKLSYVHYPYTSEAPVHVAILPMKKSRTVSTDGSMEITPIIPSPKPSGSNTETGDSAEQSNTDDSPNTLGKKSSDPSPKEEPEVT